MAIQDKTVKFTTQSKTPITLVQDSIDNTSTTLSFPYQDYVNVNRIVNNNLIHLVENFCSVNAPSPSVEGQLWLDTSDTDNKQELGRLKIYMNQDTGIKYMDVAGTVMDKNGNLRHTGTIEAFNDLNNIPVNVNEFPDDPDYYKFLTTKAHCDSNYLSGYYSQDDKDFIIRGNRYVTYTKELIYGKPFESKDGRTLVQKKFADMYYLFGKLNTDTSFNITDDKKIYYDNPIEMTQDYQLITKTKCDDKFAETLGKVTNMSANIKSIADKIKKIANDPLDTNDLAHSGAIAIANEVKRLVAARPKPTTPTPATLCGNTGTITITPPVTTSFKTMPTTDEYYTYTVPANVTSINVEATGGGGGGGGWDSRPHNGGNGGGGDKVIATAIPVTPGEVLRVYIGGGGAGGTTGVDNLPGVTAWRAPLPVATSKLPVIVNGETLLAGSNSTNTFVRRTYGSPWVAWLAKTALWKNTSTAVATYTWDVPFTVPRSSNYVVTGSADNSATITIDNIDILSGLNYASVRGTFTYLTKGQHTLTITATNSDVSVCGFTVELAETSSGFNNGGLGAYHKNVDKSNVGCGGCGGGSSAVVRDATGEVLVVAAGGGGGGGGDWNHDGYPATSLANYSTDPSGDETNRSTGGGGGGGYDMVGVLNHGFGAPGVSSLQSTMAGGGGGNRGKSYVISGATSVIAPSTNGGAYSIKAYTGDGMSGSVDIITGP